MKPWTGSRKEPFGHKVLDAVVRFLQHHQWCPTCENTGSHGTFGCWDCYRKPKNRQEKWL